VEDFKMKENKTLIFACSFLIMLLLTINGLAAGKQVKNEDAESETNYSSDRELESYDFEGDAISTTVVKKSNSTQNKNTKQVKAASVDVDGDDLSDYYQTGLASWYGREFNGKTTASGEKFDMNDSTAAHKSIPFGSIVEVTNLDNGKTTRVKINDRGPYKGSRIIDLSHYAAKQIGLVETGVSMVGINIIRRGNNTETAEVVQPKKSTMMKVVNDDDMEAEDEAVSISSGVFTIQAGAFYSKRNAD
jgi:rare lipoprotein A